MGTNRLLLMGLAAIAVVGTMAGCGDDTDDVSTATTTTTTTTTTTPATDGTDDTAPPATFAGTVTVVTPFVPVTEDCTPPEELDPDGTVSSDDPPVCTDPATAPLGSILVEVEPGVDGGDKIVFTIPQDAVLRFASGADAGFEDLAVGQQVEIGFNGQVAESYPGQATADSVTILD